MKDSVQPPAAAATAATTAPAITAAFAKMRADTARRHAFLCIGPDCCAPTAGLAAWDTLKRELAAAPVSILRTKAACLRVCHGGPWLVVYPEGTWYGEVTPDRCRRIVREHLVGGQPVREWATFTHPLDSPAS